MYGKLRNTVIVVWEVKKNIQGDTKQYSQPPGTQAKKFQNFNHCYVHRRRYINAISQKTHSLKDFKFLRRPEKVK